MAIKKPSDESLNLIQKFTIIGGFVGTIFGVFFFLDERHAHQEEIVDNLTSVQTDITLTELKLKKDILDLDLKKDSESRKYYEDMIVSGKTLDEAQKMRKNYLEDEMQRKMEAIEKYDDAIREIETKQ